MAETSFKIGHACRIVLERWQVSANEDEEPISYTRNCINIYVLGPNCIVQSSK